MRFCDKDLRRPVNLNTRWIWTLSPPLLLTVPYPFCSEYMMHIRRAGFPAPFPSNGQQPLSRARERDVCPPNDRHIFSCQTFLRQLRREKNRYCGGGWVNSSKSGVSDLRPPLTPSAYLNTLLTKHCKSVKLHWHHNVKLLGLLGSFEDDGYGHGRGQRHCQVGRQ